MRATWSRAITLVALVGGVATACEGSGDSGGGSNGGPPLAMADLPAAIADALCTTVFTCDCSQAPSGGRRWPTLEACKADVTQGWTLTLQVGVNTGLTYDATCPGGWPQGYRDLGCGKQPPQTADSACAPTCQLFHGSVARGGACKPTSGFGDDCARGLLCIYGTCDVPCPGRPAGANCGGYFRDCASGLSCDNATCASAAAVGGDCASGQKCDADSVCAGNPAVCVKTGAGGEPCSGQTCNPGLGLVCVAGACAAPKADGASCTGAEECLGGACEGGACKTLVPDICLKSG